LKGAANGVADDLRELHVSGFITGKSRAEDQIDRAVADDLVGNVDVADSCVPRFAFHVEVPEVRRRARL
jgi:hypothetical protein